MKGLLVILDGLGDRPCAVLGGRTPLEAAATPNLDALAARGLCGLSDPLYPGVPVGTQTGCATLMGLSPAAVGQLARGPVEAAGLGIDLAPGDVALHGNFATLEQADGDLRIIDRRAGRIREGTTDLAAHLGKLDLGGQVTATIHPATSHRAVVRLEGPGLSGAVSDTDPGAGARDMRVAPCRPLAARAQLTAEAVNRLVAAAHARLADHPLNRTRVKQGQLPANGLITRGAGAVTHMRSRLNHLNLRAAVVAGERTVLGVGRLFGYTVRTDPRFTSAPDTDLAAKVEAATDAFANHDVVFLHVKGPDICAHDRDPDAKRAFIERADAALEPLFDNGFAVVVTGDHTTDSNSGRHCGDPVPALLASPTGRRDDRRSFGEDECMRGGLGRITAASLLASLLDAMGAVPNFRGSDQEFFL